ncbi:MAG: REP element-mobilizing transposase RayT [Lentimonas sp.]|jgi:REP element-mobilizing transposase RayT
MTSRPTPKTENLGIGRVSIPDTRYFITLGTESRKTNLTNPITASAILNTWRAQHSTGDFTFHCATIMPDHIHWLCTLGTQLTLAQTISKFKSNTKDVMEQAGLSWQRSYYDHRLRADDAMEPFSKYIFLNPYRKQLLTISQTWPHWILSRHYKPEFTTLLNTKQGPQSKWLITDPTLTNIIENDLNHKAPKT